jgi:hypothetical protein
MMSGCGDGRYLGGQDGKNDAFTMDGTNPPEDGNCMGVARQLSASQGFLVEDFETRRNDSNDTCLQNDPSQPNPNLLGGYSACFNNCGNNCPDVTAGKIETALTQTPEDALWCSGHSLILSYDVSDGVGGSRSDRFAGYVVSFAGSADCQCGPVASDAGTVLRSNSTAATCSGFDADGLSLNYLTFWTRFEPDSPNLAPDAEVAIKDVCLQQTTVKPRAVSNGFVTDHAGSWSKVEIPLGRLGQNGIDTHRLKEISFTFAQGTGYAPSGRMYLDDVGFER